MINGSFGRPGTVPSNPSEPCQSTCPLRPVCAFGGLCSIAPLDRNEARSRSFGKLPVIQLGAFTDEFVAYHLRLALLNSAAMNCSGLGNADATLV